MPRGIPNPKPELEEVKEYDAYSPRTQAQTEPKMVTMKIDRHCNLTPAPFTILGYYKPAVVKKMPNGKMEEIEAEEFIKGEMAPPPREGVCITNKIWAGTVLEVDEDTAKNLRKNGIASLEFAA